jgi:hypothetical protein
MKKSLFFVVVLFVIAGMWVTSCTENKPTGMIGPGKIQLTSTPTPTPDVNFSVLIHQEGTPVVGVQITLLCADKAISLKAETNEIGEASFKVNEFGTYTASVDSFDGFKSQVFPVDPIGVTYTAIDYGIPRLELELVEGDELIPLHETQLKYKVTYRTKFERPVTIDSDAKHDFEVIFMSYVFRNDNDQSDIVATIPKSFEKYNTTAILDNLERQSYEFIINGNTDKGKKVVSNKRVLIRDWWFTFKGQYQFMTIYDDAEKDYKMCFYAGIKSPGIETLHNMPIDNASLKFETVGAWTDRDLGKGNFLIRDGKSAPDFTGYGSFHLLARIETKESKDYAWKINENGQIAVKISDGNNLEVTRIVRTSNNWGEACYHSFCRQPWDSFRRENRKCGTPLTSIGGRCFAGEYNITDIYRRRVENFAITIK